MPYGNLIGRHLARSTKHVATGQASLLHGSAGQGGKSDHVSGCVDVRDRGLKVLIDLQLAASIRSQSGRFKIEQITICLPPDGVQQSLAVNIFTAFKLSEHPVASFIQSD